MAASVPAGDITTLLQLALGRPTGPLGLAEAARTSCVNSMHLVLPSSVAPASLMMAPGVVGCEIGPAASIPVTGNLSRHVRTREQAI